MRKSILILFLLWVLPKAWGQNITAIEYFFDTDAGFGKNTRVNVAPSADPTYSFNPDTRSLTPGFHFLYIRTLDSRGTWSPTTRRMIEVPVQGQPGAVQAVEYFNTTDPGFGRATRVNLPSIAPDTEYSFFIPRGQLRTGKDTFYFRVVDTLGRFWSQTQRDTATVIFIDCTPPGQPLVTPGDTVLCAGQVSAYRATSVPGALGYFWNAPAGWTFRFGQGTDSASLQAPAVTAPTLYTLSVSAYNACDTGQPRAFQVLVNPSLAVPVVTAGGPLSFCDGDSVLLTASSARFYQWYRDATSVGLPDVSALQAKQSGQYRVFAANAFGCGSLSLPVTVTVFPKPSKPLISWNGTEFSTASGQAAYRWTRDGTVVSSASGNTFRPGQSGVYTVAISDVNGCIAVSDQFNLVVTGISDVRIGSAVLRCFPNPANDFVYVQASNILPGKFRVQLFDMNGKPVIDKRLMGDLTKLSSAHLSPGIYHLLISNEKERRSLKILVVH